MYGKCDNADWNCNRYREVNSRLEKCKEKEKMNCREYTERYDIESRMWMFAIHNDSKDGEVYDLYDDRDQED